MKVSLSPNTVATSAVRVLSRGICLYTFSVCFCRGEDKSWLFALPSSLQATCWDTALSPFLTPGLSLDQPIQYLWRRCLAWWFVALRPLQLFWRLWTRHIPCCIIAAIGSQNITRWERPNPFVSLFVCWNEWRKCAFGSQCHFLCESERPGRSGGEFMEAVMHVGDIIKQFGTVSIMETIFKNKLEKIWSEMGVLRNFRPEWITWFQIWG